MHGPLKMLRAVLLSLREASGAKRWLCLSIGVYIVVAFLLSQLRAWEFDTAIWDLGAYQQALASATHGGLFYESGDATTSLAPSLLLVHPGFILYTLVPLYAWWPSATLLFGVQAIVVGLAAWPLFRVAARLTGRPERALLTAVVYLAWTPILSSNLFDFHLEAFVPLELFVLLDLWLAERYVLAGAAIVVGALTFEAVPAFAVLIALFFGLPPIRRSCVLLWGALRRSWTHSRAQGDLSWGELSSRARLFLRRAQTRVAFALACVAIGSFLVVRLYVTLVVAPAVGFDLTGVHVVTGFNSSVWASLGNFQVDLIPHVEYWVLLLVLLGGLPLLAPRTAIVVVPWVTYSFLVANPDVAMLGYQYGFLTAFPLMLGFVYGLARLGPSIGANASLALAQKAPEVEAPPSGRSANLDGGLIPLGLRFPTWLWPLLIGLSLFLSPVNPMLQGSFGNGPPGYAVSYTVPSGYDQVQSEVGLIPSGSTVLASDDLFPFVANDLSAYPIVISYPPGLPFNSTHLPAFLLISQLRSPWVPSWATSVLYNRSDYGLRGISYQTPAGAVLLFQRTWSGPWESWNAPAAGPTTYPPSSLTVGPGASEVPNPQADGGTAIESDSGGAGALWYGPYTTLPAANYTLSLVVRVSADEGGLPATTGALLVQAGGFGNEVLNSSQSSLGDFQGGGVQTLSLNFTLDEPMTDFEFRGYGLDPRVSVELLSVELTPTSWPGASASVSTEG